MTDPDAAPAVDELAVGDLLELEVGPVAHGGHCVARYQGRVVFVRLALPGERVRAELTQVRTGSFCRADAVQVLRAHPDRVAAPCTHFGICGGCDFQHAAPALQRELKASVVAEQLRRLAGVELAVTVQELPGDGLGWRTRVRWALDQDGAIGPRRARSHRVVAVSGPAPCRIAAEGLSETAAVLDVPPAVAAARRGRRGELPEVTLVRRPGGRPLSVWQGEPAPVVTERAVGRDFEVAGDGFWQVHPAAPDVLAAAVRSALGGRLPAGGTAWDLYGGVGIFAAVLAELVGAGGRVLTVESEESASALAAANLASLPQVSAVTGRVDAVLPELPGPVDAIVLDPPRSGAGRQLCDDLAGCDPAVIVYVACDPAALGRDTAALQAAGYRLDSLRAFDCFPQTHHVECVAAFVRN